MKTAPAEPIEFISRSGLKLRGLLFWPIGDMTTLVLHVHGSCGNSLSFQGLLYEAAALRSHNVGLLAINTSAHDCIAEGYRHDRYVYVGGSITHFDECVDDLTGAVEFAETLCRRVVLQGHSLGCDRVIHYQLCTSDWRDTILISPCDSYRLQQLWLQTESVEQQISRLKQRRKSAKGIELLPPREYGVSIGSELYTIPVTLETFLSIAEGPPYRIFNIQKAPLFEVHSRCFVAVGRHDQLQTWDFDVMARYINARFDECVWHMFPGDHELMPFTHNFGQMVLSWIDSHKG